MRLLVRRTKPSRRHYKKLTPFERKTGWRYQVVATDITRLWGIGGSHQPQWLDVLHRAHAGVEDRVRTNKAMGLRNLPSSCRQTNCGWVLAANLAADLDAWIRLLGLHDIEDLADAEPGTLRYRLPHLPARLSRHARRRWLKISEDRPWRDAFPTCWERLTALPPAPA
jgi:Transposase DDE domain group 1